MLVMPKESFLFVPYHAGQQSLADVKIANSDARSHAAAVSRQRRDNKRLRAQLGLQRFTTPATTVGDQTVEPGALVPFFDDAKDSSVESSPPKSNSDTSVRRRQHMKAMQFSWRAGNISPELKVSDGLRIDPFSLTTQDDFSRSATDYFMQVISVVNQPIYAIFNVTNIYTTYWLELMQNDDYRPMGVAMVGAIMQRVCSPNSGSRTSEEVRSNQALGLSLLHKKYNEAMVSGGQVFDDVSIIIVLAMANLARFLGDSKAYDKHRNNMKAMVMNRGGLNALGHNGLVAAAVSQWDSFWAIERDGVPIFKESRAKTTPVYPVFPLSSDLWDMFVKLPVGFQSLIIKGKSSVEMIEVLARIAVAAADGVQALSPGNMWHSKIRKHRDFLEACPSLVHVDSAAFYIERNLTLALFLYCANAFTTARSTSSLFGGSRAELTRLLLQDDESRHSAPEKECLLWICAVCVDSWRQHGPDSPLLPKGGDLLPVLKRMKEALPSKNILQKFFHNDELLQGYDRYLSMAS